MTENEAIVQLNFDMEMIRFNPNTGETLTLEQIKARNEDNYKTYLADEVAITALMEIQELHKIGTIEEFKALKAENAQLHNEAQAINATLDELEKEVRNKAIDEFVERIENHTFTEKTEEYSNSVSFMREIRKIAEGLKGGAK